MPFAIVSRETGIPAWKFKDATSSVEFTLPGTIDAAMIEFQRVPEYSMAHVTLADHIDRLILAQINATEDLQELIRLCDTARPHSEGRIAARKRIKTQLIKLLNKTDDLKVIGELSELLGHVPEYRILIVHQWDTICNAMLERSQSALETRTLLPIIRPDSLVYAAAIERWNTQALTEALSTKNSEEAAAFMEICPPDSIASHRAYERLKALCLEEICRSKTFADLKLLFDRAPVNCEARVEILNKMTKFVREHEVA